MEFHSYKYSLCQESESVSFISKRQICRETWNLSTLNASMLVAIVLIYLLVVDACYIS